MSDISLIKKQYAIAIVDVAESNKIVDRILDDLHLIKECFSTSPELLKLLSLPSLDKNKKIEILSTALKGKISTLCENIVKLLVKKSRLYLLRDIYDAVKKEVENRSSIVNVTLTTAIPLDENLKETYKNKIKKLFNKEVTIECIVDRSIIGGYKIIGDEKIIDYTITTQLNKLRKKLTAI